MERLKRRLERVVEDIAGRYRAAGYFPSACVRVFNAHETLAAVCVGEAEEGSLFDVASLTKIATGTQTLRLMAAGKLALCDPLCACLPELMEDDWLRGRLAGVELRHLLTHTSTLVDWYPFYTRRGEDFFTALKYVLQHTERTQGVVYSDLNFMLLGKVIERVQGKPLDVCLREDLVEPLGLGRMTYCPDRTLSIVPSSYGNPIEMEMCRERGLSFGGFRPLDKPVVGEANDGNCHYYFNGVSGHAGIFADALAYERLCRYCMTTDEPIILEAQREQPGAPGRGLGLQTGLSYPHGCGHTGFTGTGIWFSRSHGVGVVTMTNRLFYREANGQATWEFRRVMHEAVFALAASLPADIPVCGENDRR